MGTLANSEDPDEMHHHAAFHQGLHCLLRLKQPSRTEIHHNLEHFICDPLKCKMDNPILILSIMNWKFHQNSKGYSRSLCPSSICHCLKNDGSKCTVADPEGVQGVRLEPPF